MRSFVLVILRLMIDIDNLDEEYDAEDVDEETTGHCKQAVCFTKTFFDSIG